jgi:phage baseplate assembly protein W
MELNFSYRITRTGHTDGQATDHVRNLIEQVLFTNPGERVNRPDFGAGLLEFVFGAQSDEMVAALQFMIQGALQQWLGDVIDVEAVTVSSIEGGPETLLQVTVQYLERRTQQRHQARFQRA